MADQFDHLKNRIADTLFEAWEGTELTCGPGMRVALDAALARHWHDLMTIIDGQPIDMLENPRAIVAAAGFGVCADPDFAEVGQPVVRIDRIPRTWRDMHALIDLIVGLGAHVTHGPEAKAELAARRAGA